MAPVMPREDSRARAEKALRLRAQGRTWAEIAATLGYRGRQSAATAVARLLDRTAPEPTGHVRARVDETLRITERLLFGRLADAAQRGDDEMIAKLVREVRTTAIERSKLVGAYAPQRAEVDVRVQAETPAQILERTRTELLAAMRQQHALEPIVDAEVVE